MYKTYYTLRKRNPKDCINDTIFDTKFDTYKEAFAVMCNLFIKNNEMWGIWKTTVSEWDGKQSMMTQAVWEG